MTPLAKGSSLPWAGQAEFIARLAHRYRKPVSALVLVIAVAMPLVTMWRFDGKTMEEGLILVGAELVLEGKSPHGDFETPYGPGDLWVVAGLFSILGTSIGVERLVGLMYRLLLLWSIHRIARRWGWGVATGATVLAWAIIAPFGLMAYSWVGAVAFGTASLALALDADRHSRFWTVAGALAGVALLFRVDLILALGLGLGPRLYKAGRGSVRRFAAGLSVGAAGYVVHLLTAGPAAVVQGMIVDPIFRLRAGRRLPVPPNWTETAEYFSGQDPSQDYELIPGFDRPAQLAALFWIMLLLAASTIGLARRGRNGRLLAVALFAAGTLPQLLQRPSHNHLRFVGVLILPAAAIAIACLLKRRAVSGAAPVLLLCCLAVVAPSDVGRSVHRTFLTRPPALSAHHEGRTIPVDFEPSVDDIEGILTALDAAAAPGDTVFVGPLRLARTNYSDTFLYHLMPEYEPGSYHLQMNPGLANRPGGRLADDVAASDWLVLTDKFDGWTEPNASVNDGDLRADAVVESSFCPIETVGHTTLFGAC